MLSVMSTPALTSALRIKRYSSSRSRVLVIINFGCARTELNLVAFHRFFSEIRVHSICLPGIQRQHLLLYMVLQWFARGGCRTTTLVSATTWNSSAVGCRCGRQSRSEGGQKASVSTPRRKAPSLYRQRTSFRRLYRCAEDFRLCKVGRLAAAPVEFRSFIANWLCH